jgi:PAS domain S-box-containing protein
MNSSDKNVLQGMTDSDRRYFSLLSDSPFAVSVMLGKEMQIVYANSLMKKIWGKGDAVEGKFMTELNPEVRDQPFPEIFAAVYETGVAIEKKEILARLNHNGIIKESYFNAVFQPHRDTDGKIIGVITIGHEVTDQVIARQAAQKSESQYHNLIYSSPSAVGILYGEEFIITIANDAMLAIFGKGKEVIGKPYFEVMPELIDQGYREIFAEVYHKGKIYNAIETPMNILRNYTMNQEYYNFMLQPQRDEYGVINGVGIFAAEVTIHALANQKIKASEEKFRRMSDLVPAKISNANADGEVTYFNRHWLDYTGKNFEELKSFGYHNIMHPDEVPEFQTLLQFAAETGKTIEMEMRFLNKKGKYKWHLNIASPILDEDGNVRMWVGSTTEIHKQLQEKRVLEKAVKERTAELQLANHELLQQNQEMEKRTAELVRVNLELTAFAYVASHDLQEPLRKIQTFAGRLSTDEHKNLSFSGQHGLERILVSASKMRELIDDLLDYSRISKSHTNTTAVDLNLVVKEVIEMLDHIIVDKKVEIIYGSLPTIDAVQFQIRQVFVNLLSNSLKFAANHRTPLIAINGALKKGKLFSYPELLPETTYCHIAISDNGIGFESQYTHQIFKLFQRLHNYSDYKGTGIGLAIVKKVVENHSGFISVSSEIDKGSTFDIYFPVSKNP